MKTEKITATVGDYKLRPDKDNPREGQKERKSIADRPFGEVIAELIEKIYPHLMR